MKVLRLKALDGSEWAVPLTVLRESYATYLRENFPHIAFAQSQIFAAIDQAWTENPNAVREWAKLVKWSAVRDQAVRIKDADPVDMQDSWIEGKLDVIEWPDARKTWLDASNARAAWPFPKSETL